MKFMSIGIICLCALGLVCWQSTAHAWVYQVSDGFENAWSGDYAPGWENSDYRWGAPPIAQMMQQTDIAHSGAHGMKLIAASVPEDWYWWAIVDNTNVNASKMLKQYNPYISVWYYDNQAANTGGQLYAVPDWVIPDDWTDVQFGSRFNQPVTSDDYYVTAGDGVVNPDPGWQDTGVARTEGWHHLEMQLSSTDGYIHFFIDDTPVGVSTRNDYTDLDVPSLATMFLPVSEGGVLGNYTLWDDFKYGSSVPYLAPGQVPEPSSIIAIITGLAGLVTVRRLRK